MYYILKVREQASEHVETPMHYVFVCVHLECNQSVFALCVRACIHELAPRGLCAVDRTAVIHTGMTCVVCAGF